MMFENNPEQLEQLSFEGLLTMGFSYVFISCGIKQKRLGGKRGAGVRGTGSGGKRGVWWKTRGTIFFAKI